MQKKLTRSNNKMVAGVCAGIADYFDLDPTLIRLGYAFLTIFTGLLPGILAYFIAIVVVPTR